MGISIYRSNVRVPSEAHTISEFIQVGNQNRAKIGYSDLSYIENRDGMEYVVKNIMEDYIYEFKNSAMGILETVSTDYNDLNLDAQNIQKALGNPENLTLLKDVMTKLG